MKQLELFQSDFNRPESAAAATKTDNADQTIPGASNLQAFSRPADNLGPSETSIRLFLESARAAGAPSTMDFDGDDRGRITARNGNSVASSPQPPVVAASARQERPRSSSKNLLPSANSKTAAAARPEGGGGFSEANAKKLSLSGSSMSATNESELNPDGPFAISHGGRISKPSEKKTVARTVYSVMPKFGVALSRSFSGHSNPPEGASSVSEGLLPPDWDVNSSQALNTSIVSIEPALRPGDSADDSASANSQNANSAPIAPTNGDSRSAVQQAKNPVFLSAGFFRRLFRLDEPQVQTVVPKTAVVETAVVETASYTLSIEPPPPPSNLLEQMECLVDALYFEARGEGRNGQFAVAEVIMNRVESQRYPNSICSVVRQGNGSKNSCQFSFYCDGVSERIHEQEAFQRAWRIAAEFMASRKNNSPLTNGATHFHTVDVRPKWASKFKKTAGIGRHLFYKETL